MKLFLSKFSYFFLIMFVSFTINAQTKFIATATPDNAAKNEYITYKLSVINGQNVQQINPPSFADFNVVGGPSQEQAMNNINGVVTQTVSLNYILQPKKAGTFTIAGCTAIADGQTYKCGPVKITVSNKQAPTAQTQPSSPFRGLDFFDEPSPQKQFADCVIKEGETVQDKVSKNMQLKVQTDKTTCYVGEPIVATYKLFTRLPTESSISKNPSFNGFSVVDLMEQVNPNSNVHEVLNGREYNIYILRKAQLYPLQAGAIELESTSLENKITFIRNENGTANSFSENVTLNSTPISIKVKPLPETGKPENFNGAVGNFEIESSIEKTNFSTDESGLLHIVISGRGNMQLLTLPEIKWPAAFEGFEPKITDNTNNLTIPISGSKTFEIPFAISQEGKYIVPAISFSFFDPATGTYKNILTKEIPLTITKGTGNKISSIPVSQKKNEPNLISSIFKKRGLLISIIGLIMIAGIYFWQRKENKKVPGKAIEKKIEIIEEAIPVALSLNKNYLEKTSACLQKDDCVDFYALLNQEMKTFLSEKLGIQKETINSKTLSTEMDNAGISNHTTLETQALLKEIEWQLYTPFERSETLYNLYAKAQVLIQTMQHQK
jgi:BatD DUF11 like domain